MGMRYWAGHTHGRPQSIWYRHQKMLGLVVVSDEGEMGCLALVVFLRQVYVLDCPLFVLLMALALVPVVY